MSFDVVVAADREWGIGKANALPWPKLKGDLAHFKRVTSEASEGRRNAVIMGRKTWESAEVAGRPLPRRLNVVITRRGLTPPEGVIVVGSIDAALDATSREAETTFIVGGAEIFREAFAHPKLRYVYLTRVNAAFGCDAHIPDLDALGFVASEWTGACEAEENGVRYRIEQLTPRPSP
jgi:dihydrofolate reductase